MFGGISAHRSSLARLRTAPGSTRRGASAAQDAVGGGHHHRGRHALVGDVADHEPDAALGQRDEVVEVAADLACRPVVRGDGPTLRRGGLLREELLLDELGDLQLVVDPLAGSRLLGAVPHEVGDADGRRRVAGQVVEQAAVIEAVRTLAAAGPEVQHADQLALGHERHHDLDAGRAHRVEGGRLEVEVLDRDGARVLLQVEEQRVVLGDVERRGGPDRVAGSVVVDVHADAPPARPARLHDGRSRWSSSRPASLSPSRIHSDTCVGCIVSDTTVTSSSASSSRSTWSRTCAAKVSSVRTVSSFSR